MYTEQNPQKAILPRQRVMTSRPIGATVPNALSGKTKKRAPNSYRTQSSHVNGGNLISHAKGWWQAGPSARLGLNRKKSLKQSLAQGSLENGGDLLPHAKGWWQAVPSARLGLTSQNTQRYDGKSTKKEPQVRCELKALMKMAATYSPTGVQYHRRDCA